MVRGRRGAISHRSKKLSARTPQAIKVGVVHVRSLGAISMLHSISESMPSFSYNQWTLNVLSLKLSV